MTFLRHRQQKERSWHWSLAKLLHFLDQWVLGSWGWVTGYSVQNKPISCYSFSTQPPKIPQRGDLLSVAAMAQAGIGALDTGASITWHFPLHPDPTHALFSLQQGQGRHTRSSIPPTPAWLVAHAVRPVSTAGLLDAARTWAAFDGSIALT